MAECYFCHRPACEKHHAMHGVANRKLADKYGLIVDLCGECHRGDHGVHGKHGHDKDLALKEWAQRTFERRFGEAEWMRVFGRSYK